MKVLAFLLIFLLMDSFSQSQSVDPLLTEDMIAELPLVKQPEAPCKPQLPLYSDKDKKPIWLDTTGLMKRVIHCEGPQFPPLARRARIEGKVKLSILVNPEGNMECIKVISGHAMLNASAVDAAKKWKFKPMMQEEESLGFLGILEFQFSTSDSCQKNDPCLCAHW